MTGRLRPGARAVAAALAVAAAVAVVGPSGDGSAGAAPKRPVDLVGTWEGDYSYPSPDGSVHPSHQTLVIERQDGVHLWGNDEFVDRNGAVVRIPVLGTVTDGDIGLAEKSGFFLGRLTGRNTMVMRFVLVGETPTSFRVTLKRTAR